MRFILRLAVSAVAVWVSTLLPGIAVTATTVPGKIGTLLLVAVIFGVVNAVIRPIVKTVGCAFYIATLGLVALLVNGLLFLLTGWIASRVGLPFTVHGLLTAVLGALIVGVVSWVLSAALPDK